MKANVRQAVKLILDATDLDVQGTQKSFEFEGFTVQLIFTGRGDTFSLRIIKKKFRGYSMTGVMGMWDEVAHCVFTELFDLDPCAPTITHRMAHHAEETGLEFGDLDMTITIEDSMS